MASIEGQGPHLIVCPTVEQTPKEGCCVFCGRALVGRRSKEHVFARWLLAHYNSERTMFGVDWRDDETGELRGTRKMPMSRLVAGRVCISCNNGWMSDLETEAKGTILSLASDPGAPLPADASGKEKLARWAAKTAFAARAADPGPRLVASNDAQKLAQGTMPKVFVVAARSRLNLGLGWLATQRWLVDYPDGLRDEVIRQVGRSHKTVIRIGHLLIAICHWPAADWPMAISLPCHTPLWPQQDWLAYQHRTDAHGTPPTPETEVIDLAAGTRMVHPQLRNNFQSISWDAFAGS